MKIQKTSILESPLVSGFLRVLSYSLRWLTFGLTTAHPASTSTTFCLVANGLTCAIQDGKIYVNDVLRGEATVENIEEMKGYNEMMREWTKRLHQTMYQTLQKIINDMFGEHGSFWRNLRGPFWETLNAYNPDSDPMKPDLAPEPEPESLKQFPEKPLVELPAMSPLPEPPSFCKP